MRRVCKMQQIINKLFFAYNCLTLAKHFISQKHFIDFYFNASLLTANRETIEEIFKSLAPE